MGWDVPRLSRPVPDISNTHSQAHFLGEFCPGEFCALDSPCLLCVHTRANSPDYPLSVEDVVVDSCCSPQLIPFTSARVKQILLGQGARSTWAILAPFPVLSQPSTPATNPQATFPFPGWHMWQQQPKLAIVIPSFMHLAGESCHLNQILSSGSGSSGPNSSYSWT